MKKNDRFGKEWSSDSRDQQYPSDTQATQGLGFLGADAPTTGLHDALWQANDWKDNWLYDQIKTACERYGQSLDLSVDGSRSALADAIRQALLSQNQASESRVGILEIASREETAKGEDGLRAVVPVHLKAVLDDRFSQLGSASTRNESDFDPAGAARAVKDSLGSAASCSAYREEDPWIPGSYNELLNTKAFAALRNKIVPFIGRTVFEGKRQGTSEYKPLSEYPFDSNLVPDMDAISNMSRILNALIDVREKKENLKQGAYSEVINDVWTKGADKETVGSKAFAGLRNMLSNFLNKNVFEGRYKDSSKYKPIWEYPHDAAQMPDMDALCELRDQLNNLIIQRALKSELGSAAYKSKEDFDSAGTAAAIKNMLGEAAYLHTYHNDNGALKDLPWNADTLISCGTVKALMSYERATEGVGSYAFAIHHTNNSYRYGDRAEGTSLEPASADPGGAGVDRGRRLSGTWECRGSVRWYSESSSFQCTTLWMRIS